MSMSCRFRGGWTKEAAVSHSTEPRLVSGNADDALAVLDQDLARNN